MPVLIHALTVDNLAAIHNAARLFAIQAHAAGHYLANHQPPENGLAGGVPNPPPVAPPGLSSRVRTLLSWWKWVALAGGIFGLIACGVMMAIGRRNRSNLAADGAAG